MPVSSHPLSRAKVHSTANDSWQDYLNSAAEHFDGTKFEDVARMNPYTDYTPGLWDKIGNLFGFATNEDKMEISSKEYLSQLYQNQREEEYNSPLQAAQRMRDAGLNPALSGIENAGQASEFDNQAPSPQLQGAADVLGPIMSAISGGFQLYGQIENIRSTVLANDEREFNLNGGAGAMLTSLAAPFFADGGINPHYSKVTRGKHGYSGGYGYMVSVPGVDGSMTENDQPLYEARRVEFPSLSRRNMRRLQSSMMRYLGDPASRARYYSDSEAASAKRRGYFYESSRPDSGGYDDDITEVISEVIVPLVKDEFKTRQNKAKFDAGYSEGRLGTDKVGPKALGKASFDADLADASATQASSRLETQDSTSEYKKGSMYAKLVDKLSRKAENGNMFAAAVLLFMDIFSDSGPASDSGIGALAGAAVKAIK